MNDLIKTIIQTILLAFIKEIVKDIYLKIKANKTNRNYTHNLDEYNKEKQDVKSISFSLHLCYIEILKLCSFF